MMMDHQIKFGGKDWAFQKYHLDISLQPEKQTAGHGDFPIYPFL